MKKNFLVKTMVIVLTSMAVSIQAQAADHKICSENELVGIAACTAGTARSEFYDCDGNYVGFLNTNLGENEIAKIEKHTLTPVYEDKTISIYDCDTPIRKVAEYPSAKMGVTMCKDGYVIGDYGNQEITLYSNEGTCLYQTKAYFEGSENEDVIYMFGVSVTSTPSGYYLAYMKRTSEGEGGYPFEIIGISKDGSVQTTICTGDAATEWDSWELPVLRAVGDYLVYDGNTYNYAGECVLQDTVCTYETAEEYDDSVKPNGILARGWYVDGIENYVLYDETLTQIQRNMLTEELGSIMDEARDSLWQRLPAYDYETLSHVPSDHLNGKLCAGFIPYCGPSYSPVYIMKDNVEGWIPYARTEEGAVIYLNGESRVLALSEAEELSAVNDYLYLTREISDGWTQRIRRIDTGEVLVSEENAFLCLEKDFAAGYLSWESGRDENIIDIDRDTYEINYRKVHGLSMPWSDNCLVVKRSIYRGITDREGNWIVKIINGGMD